MRKLMMIAMLALSSLCLYAERVESKPLELLLDIEESSNISIGFAKEAVTSTPICWNKNSTTYFSQGAKMSEGQSWKRRQCISPR